MAHLLIHRGLAKKNFIENTISSFRYCFKKKYGIETDIHCTKDNHPKKAPAIFELFSDFDFITLSLLNLLFSTK